MILLGSERPTKDVDVEVETPKEGYDALVQLFEKDPDYGVLHGTRRDGLRVIHKPSGTGVDVLMR